MRKLLVSCLVILLFTVPAAVSAHPHSIDTPNNDQDQVIANGQNHAPFIAGVSCETVEYDPLGIADPAGYGLETAHHGPDAGTPGKADDGCYETTGNVPPGADVTNPVITNP